MASTPASWAEKLSIRRATLRLAILLSNQRSHSSKMMPVIQAFLLCRHTILKFAMLTFAAVKARGLFALPMNYIGSRSVPAQLLQKWAEMRAFSLLTPGRLFVERDLSGTIFQKRPVSSQLKMSKEEYFDKTSRIAAISFSTSARSTLPSSPWLTRLLTSRRDWNRWIQPFEKAGGGRSLYCGI